uniref:Uncharacterized protein n=1 Tax=Panagrolaimus davidi TaxID=227884 RepID=A0A914QT87_9BILA
MTCQRCRYYYNKDKKQWPFSCIASMDYNVETNEVDCDPSQIIHFKECCPEEMSKVRGISLRREIQNSVQYVGVKTISTALSQMDREVTLRYAGLGQDEEEAAAEEEKYQTAFEETDDEDDDDEYDDE